MKHKTIIIIDDDPDDRDMFCEAVGLIEHTCKCEMKQSCEEALNYLKKTAAKPDYIFLDINMPRLNGLQCLQRLKQDAELKEIPVIIYSTSSNKKEIDAMLKAGASSYIVKPDSYNKLSAILLKFLSDN